MTIRRATTADVSALTACVEAAYAVYVPRMGKKPAPMLADYGRLVREALVFVVDQAGTCVGLIVLHVEADHLFIENIAIAPACQGRGLGGRLLAFAESEAIRLGLSELRLYTNEMMTENLAFYTRLGFEETARRTEDGYARVFFRKRIGTDKGSLDA